MSSTDIQGLTADSRRVRPGYLFAALPGHKTDGRAYIADALARGAAAILAEPGAITDLPVPAVADANPRRRLALMASRFYGQQPRMIAAVTGTNGKTSVVNFARQVWRTLGHSAASLGTLGITSDAGHEDGSLTTPDPVALHETLARLASDGITHLAFEASSHGLEQFRLDGVEIAVAAFTNLTRDHLDYHGTTEAYRAAKLRLFRELLRAKGVAVLNADAGEASAFRAACVSRGLTVLDYGRTARAIRLESLEPEPTGQRLVIALEGQRHEIRLPLVAAFQAMNALAALGIAIGSGENPSRAVKALEALSGVRGRVERVVTLANGAAVYVDYAHTPDALETVLTALRPHAHGRLVVVFGCGGDRDRGKRPIMGEIAARLADGAIVTDDNPRGENAAVIRRQVMAGCPDAQEVSSRAEAIATAISGLAEGDVLVIAGKGHERTQTIGDAVMPFDDAEVARQAALGRTA
ncbi:MAG: UDP-N-acetylmuramoyl-L-alanyl-D-glutamate--2,6-diaminopimelate ligase [Alphaproteobacteria bacterium]